MQHILVTGGAGFLGSHLCDLLLAKGCRVTAVDNLVTGSIENIAHNMGGPAFAFLEHDITTPLSVTEPINGVFNLASPASPVDYRNLPLETLEAGSTGVRNMLELAAEHEAVFLQASTSEVYGDPLVHPQTEDYWGNVNPIGPRSVYDEAKRFAEALTTAYQRTHGLRIRIARIFNTYGPRMRLGDGRVVPNLISQALMGMPLTVYGDGLQTRSFCYVSDEVEGLYRLFRSDCAQPVNVGSPSEISVLKFAQTILRLTGCASEIVFEPLPVEDPVKRQPDISKAKHLLGWEPRVPLEEGLKRTIEYFRDRTAGESTAAARG